MNDLVVDQSSTDKQNITECYHCGLDCRNADISINDKVFCCNGCKTVYNILNDNDLNDYYALNKAPGQTPSKSSFTKKYAYLDDKTVQEQIQDFSDGKITKVTFRIPAIHCSSCIWILESLNRLDDGIRSSRSNFTEKQVSVTFQNDTTTLRKIVELLASLGYEPEINFESASKKAGAKTKKTLYTKLGIAGFALGNIMLLSLPEYLSGSSLAPQYQKLFGYLNIILATPVLIYSARGYFRSAYGGLRHRSINIDVPIALGIIALFSRSIVDILMLNGAGYLDSFVGFIFFLLLGKLFQEKTYQSLSFDRDFKSYFPLAVVVIKDGKETTLALSNLEVGDRIVIRNNEIIPADSILINGDAWIDYSFVTGESDAVKKVSGDKVFAGGKQEGSAVELEIVKNVSQSYLTSLWNDDTFINNEKPRLDTIANSISKYFTLAVVTIAAITGLYWLKNDPTLAVNAFTSVLIIACPCALALSVPFTLGNTMRIFGRKHFYLKNTHIIEILARITTIIFDKTGTLTEAANTNISFIPEQGSDGLTSNENELIRSIARQSNHPLRRQLYTFLSNDKDDLNIIDYNEISGKGLEGKINGIMIKIGSPEFVSGTKNDINGTAVVVSINDVLRGVFTFSNSYRSGVKGLIKKLSDKYKMWLLSGDNDRERPHLSEYFDGDQLLFNQSSFAKMDHIHNLQDKGEIVLMTGDGLNDAGALKASDAGISISENINTFSPACDAILGSRDLHKLEDFLKFSVTSMNIIKASFVISFLYNIIGLSFAVQGLLSPLLSAILMPLSSITVVTFATVLTNYLGRKI